MKSREPGPILADASCLIIYQNIGATHLLNALFGEITITAEVASEIGSNLPPWITVQNPISSLDPSTSSRLDKGEASLIALALEHQGTLLIIDDRVGRAIANQKGINIIGSSGILLLAKQKGYITSVRIFLDKMIEHEFRISEQLRRGILTLAGEK